MPQGEAPGKTFLAGGPAFLYKGAVPKIERALVSVSDKKGVVEFVRVLASLKVEILSTGGTARTLTESKIPVLEVSSFTGQPEILDGRVKTLHPKIHGGLLAVRSNKRHQEELKASGIRPIDLVVVNLYPFEETVARGASFEEAIENIDIGGPSIIRAAAKNWQDVTVVVDPADYEGIAKELREGGGEVSRETNFRLAKKAFALTGRYDGAIANHLSRMREAGGAPSRFPEVFSFQVERVQDLRYGENPHQAGRFYREPGVSEPCVANARQLHGKELSYNNLLDLDAAIELVKDFPEPSCAILKHNNPCGVAQGKVLAQVFAAALGCDPDAAFGGIIGFNRPVDPQTAAEIGKDFYECVVAPSFDPEALEVLKGKKNIRLMETGPFTVSGRAPLSFQKVCGGLLVQERDLDRTPVREGKVVTKRSPTDEEWQALQFAWRVVKHVKSNAIVFASADRTLGIGAGQMSRIDSVRIAISKARASLKGSAMASDAFFPFRDNVDAAAKAGAAAIVQPGGSIRDAESITAADEQDLAMVFTGIRHFRH